MKFLKISFLFMFFFLITESVFSDFNYEGLSNQEKKCYDLIKNEAKNFDFSKSIKSSQKDIPYDFINGTVLFDSKLFNKKSYYYGKSSQINIEELFPNLKIYGEENKENIYKSNLSFFNIKKENKDIFFYCSFTKNTAISTNIEDLKNLDITSTYTTFPSEMKIEDINYDDNLWKKFIIKNKYRNRDGSKVVLESEKVIFIPKNKELIGYYDLYNYIKNYYAILSGYEYKINWYLDGINGKDKNFPKELGLKQIYNNNGIEIKRNYINGKVSTDIFGIQYVFVNGKNFYNNLIKYIRYNLFSCLISEKSPLAGKIIFLKDENIDVNGEVLYSLGYQDLNKTFEIIPYYTDIDRYIKESYFKVKSENAIGENIDLSKEDYINYIKDILFNINNKDEILNSIYKYEHFLVKYTGIDLENSSIDEKKEFIKLYGELLPKNNIFKDNDKIKKLLDDPEIKKVYENIYNLNLKTIIIISSIILIFLIGGFVYYKKNY